MPKTTTSTKLPVLVWGNGGCSGDGSSNARFLQMLASHGYLAIASGAPGGRTSTTAAMMTASIDFVTKVAGTGDYANVDKDKIMAAGFSCGGVEAMAQSWDPRVKSIGIFSSGLLTNYTAASTFKKPIFYVLGGSSDIAYANVSLFRSNTPSLPPPNLSRYDFLASEKLITGGKRRASAISKPSQPKLHHGKATCPSAMVETCSRPTAANSARPALPGWTTFSRATRQPRLTSWGMATKLMGGKSKHTRWISCSPLFKRG